MFEAPLVLIFVLLPIILGIMDFGLAFGRYQALTSAVRKGGRHGVSPCPYALAGPDCGAGVRPSPANVTAVVIDTLASSNIRNANIVVDPAMMIPMGGTLTSFTSIVVNVPHTFMFIPCSLSGTPCTVTLSTNVAMRNEDQ